MCKALLLLKVDRARRDKCTKHELHGSDPVRIANALAFKCCKRSCLKSVDAAAVQEVCTLWHCHFTAVERRSFLHFFSPMDASDEEAPTAQHKYSLCGRPVCRGGLLRALGVSDRFWCSASRGGIDLRRAIPGAAIVREAPQAERVHEFFLGLYKSAAEPLPHEQHIVKGSVDENIALDERIRSSGVPEDADAESDDPNEEWDPDASVVPSFAAFLGGTVGVQKRYLTHNSLTGVYWLMLATMEDDETEQRVPSMATFHGVWWRTWRHYLGFRKTSQHAECKFCFAYREQMHQRELGAARRMSLAREWRLHLRSAYHDRLIYWWCRYASRQRMDVLTIIIDSMDKAKFSWPQYPWGRKDKRLEGIRRPRLVVTGVIAHGYCTQLYVADEHLSHGASAFCDVLGRVLEFVWSHCQATGKAFPKHLVVQSDNTTAQAKNTYVTMFLAFLVAKYKFATTNLFFLPVGHTHEDIDQFFGVILEVVLKRVPFQTPSELVALLQERLAARVAAKGEVLHVMHLTGIRDFSAWLSPIGITLHNAFVSRDGLVAPHAFSFKLKQSLAPREQRQAEAFGGRSARANDGDVLCVYKTWMHSCESKDPIVVLTPDRCAMVQLDCPTEVIMPGAFSDREVADIQKLAATLRMPQYNLHEGADALEALLAGPAPYVLPASDWLSAVVGVAPPMVTDTGSSIFTHLPDTSWNLLARFHRAA